MLFSVRFDCFISYYIRLDDIRFYSDSIAPCSTRFDYVIYIRSYCIILGLFDSIRLRGLTHSISTLKLFDKSFSLLFDFGLKLLRIVFKISIFSNPDPRVEILKHIVYENQCIFPPNRDPKSYFWKILLWKLAVGNFGTISPWCPCLHVCPLNL